MICLSRLKPAICFNLLIHASVSNLKQDEQTEIGSEGGDKEFVVGNGSEEIDKFMGKAINASIVLGVGTLAVTRLLAIDHEYWHGWTFYEILRYAPEHNWFAYEEALKENPVLAKMVISGVVYSLGDWIAQRHVPKGSYTTCKHHRQQLDFEWLRITKGLRLTNKTLHGQTSFTSHSSLCIIAKHKENEDTLLTHGHF
ncbi:hypothetical protein L2E82_43651 [Cichorium intybus]|uniref:Uncharacterized protein n=1 Tax=Cichorium intybus TaxID=13427 RepID=A0ACB8ZNU4_CICIN|nr:hypothetical protein L2E82_43651 [Cichorium intybus]